MKNFIFCGILLIYNLSWGIEPIQPDSLCERYIKDEEIQSCLVRISKVEIDWYAAGICHLQKEESLFNQCLSLVIGKTLNPKNIEICSDEERLTDIERLDCLKKNLQRSPASENLFQEKTISRPGVKNKSSQPRKTH